MTLILTTSLDTSSISQVSPPSIVMQSRAATTSLGLALLHNFLAKGITKNNEMFKLALANASRHVLLRSFYESILHFLSMNNAMGKLQGRGIVCTSKAF